MIAIDAIAFDADDTLWHNEILFSMTQERFRKLLVTYHRPEWIDQKLYETEVRNLKHFGYAVKGFTLSMIETAIELTEGGVSGQEIMSILDFGKEMLTVPVELLDHVAEVVPALAQKVKLALITKGDLLSQETKIARSGLADYFTYIEIVSEKTPATYQTILDRYQMVPERFLMIGNSMRSDVLPVVEIGGIGVHLPYHVTCAHEQVAEKTPQHERLFVLESLLELPGLVEGLEAT
jgi:putative hydrolase of the HAD superfamily